jgi:hypothetical protein
MMDNNTMQGSEGTSPTNGSHPIIIGRDNGFCVHLPELNVSGEGKTVEEAYREFTANLAAFKQLSKNYGLGTIGLQYAPVRKTALWRELSLFFTKTAVAAAAVIIVVVLLLPNIGAAVRHQVSAMVPATLKDPLFWMVQFPTKVNGRLDRMEPADSAQMNKEWSKLLDRSMPILRALKCPN